MAPSRFGPARTAPADGMSDVERLLAYEEIRQLAARYALAVDRRDADTLVGLFVADVRMPGGGGGLATRGIRELSSNTKVIAFSGYTDPAIATEMYAAGASIFLPKGSPITTILRSIRTAASAAYRPPHA